MSTTTHHETEIIAGQDTPTITIVREFDAPPERVFRCYADPALYARWVGPRSVTTDVGHWDFRRGGSYTFENSRDGEVIASFYGSFHEVREAERIVQTFTWEGAPDGVSLDTLTLEPLPGGRTRSVALSVVDSFETRDAILSSGMDTGVEEGYEKLDELLQELR
ncbi:SRPBCC family protein [Nocardioides insulae]|uniref:SRPBCC family protein n=1 Tax=Nocardioides insulae TaxID=394734 RepID=UPI0004230BFA|nr:SRPBCC family protein [Nocardioides insulae]